ncbi:methyl-accepting chemotaxis protein [Desulfosarcina cetonica]|uniref:methyl-accepting chemotaxis protein n=1 Tax=Desulfosarcina cetonica TaxID=90730 RepID=UPI0006D0F353|nr:HAMP domain-containing protein [Desulfosarcina cetonica]
MKLYIKLFLIVFIGILAISGLSGILQIRRETQFFKAESQRAAIILGQVLADEISNEWDDGGIAKVREILSKAGNADPKVRFRWVWFDAAQDAADRPEVDVSQLLANHAGSVHVFEKPDASGEMRIYYYFPILLSTARHGGLELSQSLSSITQYTRNTLVYYVIMSFLLILAIGSILAMGSFWLLAKPLHRVIQRTREIHSGKLEGRLNLHRRDEIGELATSIDKMSEQILRNRAKLQEETKARIEALEQLRHADRLRSVGRSLPASPMNSARPSMSFQVGPV